MPEYNADIIVAFAKRLYREATTVVATYIVAGIIIGAVLGIAGALGYEAMTRTRTDLSGIAWPLGAVVGGLVGYARAAARAFELRLRAQLALCQVEIERNTRALTTRADVSRDVDAPGQATLSGERV